MLVLKGFIIGIGKIIPGVSGSLLAMSLGVYQKAIDSIIYLFKNPKENILYLGQLALGIILSIICCSNIIVYLLEHYFLYTMSLFIGLMIGNIPSSLKEVQYTKKTNYIYLLISFILVYIIYQFKFSTPFIPTFNMGDFIVVFALGFLDALTMIVPGVSGTALFMMLNCYYFVMHLFSHLFLELPFTIIFGFGLVVGSIFTTILVHFLFKKHKDIIHLIILGFTITSLIVLIKSLLSSLTFFNSIPTILLAIVGFLLTKKLEKIS